MGSEWKEYSLEEVTELIIDCPHSTPKWTEEGVVVLRNQNIRNGKLDLTSPSFTNEKGYKDRIKRAIPKEDDLVFTREAPMGEVCKVPKGLRCCLGQRMVLLRADKNKIDPTFLLYEMQSPNLKHQISWNEGTGTTVSNIRIPNIKAFKINVPPLHEQKAIAHILGSLDDKIELNRQMNQTLEQMAQALFKSWFVDFDPVIDNALAAGNEIPEPLQKRAEQRVELGDARKPLPENIQNLFPAEFTFLEELDKWVPLGWTAGSIYDVMNIIYGAPFKSKHFNSEENGMPIIRIRDLKTGTPQNWSEEIHPKGTLIEKGDVVVGMDAEFKPHLWKGPTGFLNQRLFNAKPRLDSVSKYFILYSLMPLLEMEEKAQVGTTVSHLGKKDIDKFRILLPPSLIHRFFKKNADEFLSKFIINTYNLESLSKLRDTLLPKLVSGEVRVPEGMLTQNA